VPTITARKRTGSFATAWWARGAHLTRLDYQTPLEVFVNLLGRAKLGELAAKQVNVQ
jgi:hypothetical protein